MPFTTLTPIVAPGPFDTAGVVVAATAYDVANGNQFVSTGREILIINNTDVGAHTFTVNSTPDQEGRTGNLTQSVGASARYVTQMFPVEGWANGSGMITIPSGQDSHFMLAVVRFPI